MSKYLKYIVIGLAIVIIGLVISLISINKNYIKSKELNSSYIELTTNLENQNFLQKITIEQLNNYQDTIVKKLDSTRKALNIKDKNIKQLQYMLTQASKKDTVIFRDTIFKDPNLKLDTIKRDKWYELKLSLEYPNIIRVEPKFISEKSVIIDYSNKIIGEPKKCWIGRLFQKRNKVVEVVVIENSPYIETKEQRFLEIVK